jgi:hypothetical protein
VSPYSDVLCKISKEAVVLRWGVVSPSPRPQAEPSLVGYPWVLTQYIRSYPPYLEAVSSIRIRTMRLAVVTGTHITWEGIVLVELWGHETLCRDKWPRNPVWSNYLPPARPRCSIAHLTRSACNKSWSHKIIETNYNISTINHSFTSNINVFYYEFYVREWITISLQYSFPVHVWYFRDGGGETEKESERGGSLEDILYHSASWSFTVCSDWETTT